MEASEDKQEAKQGTTIKTEKAKLNCAPPGPLVISSLMNYFPNGLHLFLKQQYIKRLSSTWLIYCLPVLVV